tara:strand:- start:1490 stop:2509 length:1020 start_codon:yes stop_codon:yes gene_type:complete
MKFVDEAIIKVAAGNGGSGCLSFRREKFVAKGGPDGGDGGDGGSVYFVASDATNTLADFRITKMYTAKNGTPGAGKNMTGKSGEDLEIIVPVGTTIFDIDTSEIIGDLSKINQRIKVAEGGEAGLGNTRFKSSVNRAPRKITKGTQGETRRLHLELKLIADVGLLGMPNAGKSSLIRKMSSAKPKVADYPFTTLHPNLGVVSVGFLQSFVMADIPGLIQGAAEGSGLGIRFLKHLQRTRILLHMVDIGSHDNSLKPMQAFKDIEKELSNFSQDLIDKPRWLIINKIDLLPDNEINSICREFTEELNWNGPIHKISAISGEGVSDLGKAIMLELDSIGQD